MDHNILLNTAGRRCHTNWSFAGVTVLKPLVQLFKRAFKVLDRKPLSYHHCVILAKYRFLSFANFKSFKQVCMVYKTLHGFCPPPLGDFIKKKLVTSHRTRSTSREDCEVPRRRTTFGQNVLSVQGSLLWNSLPNPIRDSPTFSVFKRKVKNWLLEDQTCDHI